MQTHFSNQIFTTWFPLPLFDTIYSPFLDKFSVALFFQKVKPRKFTGRRSRTVQLFSEKGWAGAWVNSTLSKATTNLRI